MPTFAKRQYLIGTSPKKDYRDGIDLHFLQAHKMSDPEDRLRERPSERFAGSEHLFNLDAETEKLRDEPGGTKKRHRQITLFCGGGMSLALFDFDAGGGLSDHATDGYVTVHVLEGEAQMKTAGHEYDMPAGSLLVLTPPASDMTFMR